jgi:type IV pilus assembly protein PilC
MPDFTYFARDIEGKGVKGKTNAASSANLAAVLKGQGLIPISIREVKPWLNFTQYNRKPVKLTELAFFFRQLSTMISAGITINSALRELSSQIKSPTLADIIDQSVKDIEKGDSFSKALSRFPDAFPSMIVAMVRAGEEGGTLSYVLDQVSVYLEDKVVFRREVKSATTYPLFVLIFFGCALTFITLYLLPKFKVIFAGMDVQLPPITRVVMAASSFLVEYILFIAVLMAGAVFSCYRYYNTKNGRRFFDRLALNLPIFGETSRLVLFSYFSQTLAVLFSGGIPVMRCLEIVGPVLDNSLIEDALKQVLVDVENGNSISQGMSKQPIFPGLLIRMIKVGEQTGQLGEMLTKISRFYRDEAMSRTKRLTSLLEPVMIVGMALMVGIVIVAIYLPIFKMAGGAKM